MYHTRRRICLIEIIINNYRSLTISDRFGKVVTKILNRRLIQWLESEQLSKLALNLSNRLHTIILFLIHVRYVISIKINKPKAVYMCFIDLERSFYTASKDLLLYKLLKINISSKCLQLIRSLYQDMRTCLKINNCYTNSFPVEIGTHQGYTPSSNLFKIFINDSPFFGHGMLNTRRCLM